MVNRNKTEWWDASTLQGGDLGTVELDCQNSRQG